MGKHKSKRKLVAEDNKYKKKKKHRSRSRSPKCRSREASYKSDSKREQSHVKHAKYSRDEDLSAHSFKCENVVKSNFTKNSKENCSSDKLECSRPKPKRFKDQSHSDFQDSFKLSLNDRPEILSATIKMCKSKEQKLRKKSVVHSDSENSSDSESSSDKAKSPPIKSCSSKKINEKQSDHSLRSTSASESRKNQKISEESEFSDNDHEFKKNLSKKNVNLKYSAVPDTKNVGKKFKSDHEKFVSEENEERLQKFYEKPRSSDSFDKNNIASGIKESQDELFSRDKEKKDSHDEEFGFQFELYRYELNRIFCRDAALILDKEDFWLFVKKYETMKKMKRQKISVEELEKKIQAISLPPKLSHSAEKLLKASDEELMALLPPFDEDDERKPLTKLLFREFRFIILVYLDFREKEKLNKEKKIKESRANLPIAQYRDEIISKVASERVVIIAGDTGCGKSTQIPQYLIEAGYSKIACTQPRRIACVSLSKRVAYETMSESDNLVGYQIRFEKHKRQETKIVFITEGLFLRQVSNDGWGQYDVVVLDEVHERHLTADFLLGVVKCLIHQRQDLKVILMSATINIKLVCNYFGDLAQVIQVPGRLHPIKLEYHPLPISERSERFDPAPYLRIMQLIDKKYSRDERGDLLIFVSGMSEISAIIDAAKGYNEKDEAWIILPLHSCISLADQDKVFDYPPEGMRKCIVSTNIAETSITIDGIRFVADSGKVKEMMYDFTARMQKLKEVWISRASAEQRKGRAGRTGPGVCYRLYSEEEYTELAPYSTPEIQRVPLDSSILQMVAMGLPDPRKFPFIEPPPLQSIEDSITSLKQHSALSSDESLTTIGEMLSRLPVDIPLGKMLINGSLFHQLEPTLSLTAALSVQNPFTNRAYRDPDCENARKQLESDHGDPLTLLNAYREWLEVKSGKQKGVKSRQWCRKRGLEEQRFYEMTKLRKQFKQLLQDCNLLPSEKEQFDKLSSTERAFRHGELKLLRSAKRQHQNEAPRKKRILKPDAWELMREGEEDAADKTLDIGDIDFRLAHDNLAVENLLSGSTTCSYKDLTMLKLILCSGLYPQLAIADELNHVKTVSEKLFHTQTKPFVSLHPLSFFANHAEMLNLSEHDILDVVAPGFSPKYPVSSKHQLLTYMSLLETSKPFLVNTMRIPAAHSLLLFSHQLHTNVDFSNIVCDSWIQLRFPLPEAAETLVLKAIKLRLKWEELLQLRLENSDCSDVEQSLCQNLVSYMTAEIGYSIQRLLPASLKTIYTKCVQNFISGPNPINPDFEITENTIYGGYQMCSFLVYDCLESESASVWESWTCNFCGLTAALSPFEKLQHKATCSPDDKTEDEEKSTVGSLKPNSKLYKCPECNQEIYLTPVEILKHRKSHIQAN